MECKLCPKIFSNGKALGAHMKSHFAPLPLPKKTPKKEGVEIQPTMIFSDLDDFDDRKPLDSFSSYGLRKNSKKKEMRDVEDVKKDIQQKVTVKNEPFDVDVEFEMMREEDVAMCLMMLSRNVRKIYTCERCNRVLKSSQCLGSHSSVIRRGDQKKIGRLCDDGLLLKNEVMFKKKKSKLICEIKQMEFEDGDDDDGLLDLNLPAYNVEGDESED